MKSLFKIFFFLLFANLGFASPISDFGISLFTKLSERGDNLVFSPFTIYSNLDLLSKGADGSTALEFQKVLKSSENHFQYPSLKVANGLFLHQESRFLPAFQEIAEHQLVDYKDPEKAALTINRWISEKTEGKIPHLIQSGDIDPLTRLTVISAIHFEDEWLYPFDPLFTAPGYFSLEKGGDFQVEMMQQTHLFPYFENEQLQALFLPLKKEGMHCLFLLPKTGNLLALENDLNWKEMNHYIDQAEVKKVEVVIPKFSFSKRVSLNEPLKEMGLNEAFTRDANFSKISLDEQLSLDQVLHETFFSMNENGISAASATSSSMGVTCIPVAIDPIIPFIADRPFVFALFDEQTKSLLFIGHVINPTKSSL